MKCISRVPDSTSPYTNEIICSSSDGPPIAYTSTMYETPCTILTGDIDLDMTSDEDNNDQSEHHFL